MTQIRVFHITFAGLVAVRSVPVRGAGTHFASFSFPAGGAQALSRAAAGGIVRTVALLGTVQAVRVQRTLVHAHFAHETWRAFATTGDMMTRGIVQAMAMLLAVLAMTSGRTLVGAHIPSPAGGAFARSILRIAASIVLTATVLLALGAMFSIGAEHVASWDWK